MSTRRTSKPPPKAKDGPKIGKTVSLPKAIKLLGVPLDREDFELDPATGLAANRATPKMLTALTNFGIEPDPRRTPFHVGRKVIAALVERANDPDDPCILWQLSKLVGEYGWSPKQARLLSYDQAMAEIDREKARRGQTYRPKAKPKPPWE